MANRYLRASGNWNGPVWAATSGGAPGSAATPTGSDEVYIAANFTVTLTADAACSYFQIEQGRFNLNGYKLDCGSTFRAREHTAKIIDLSGGILLVGSGVGETGATFSVADNPFNSNVTLIADDSLVRIRKGDTTNIPMGDYSYNDVVVELGTHTPSATTGTIYGSPTFRSLIIQSKNSAAHTVKFDGYITLDKFVAVGSSTSNRLKLLGNGSSGLNFNSSGSCYGQYLQISEPDDVTTELYSGGVPLYIGANSITHEHTSGYLTQDPPKISTLVDPLTTAPASNTNWTVSGTVTQVTTGREGGGYKFGPDSYGSPVGTSNMISSDTYDLTDSEIVIEVISFVGVDYAGTTIHLGGSSVYTGWTGEASTYAGWIFNGEPSAIERFGLLSGDSESRDVGDSRGFLKLSISGNILRFWRSGNGVDWENVEDGSYFPASVLLSDLDLLLFKSVRIPVLSGGYDAGATIGSINSVPEPLLIDATSDVDPGFTNTVTPSDTDPFNSGQKVAFKSPTVKLESGTYYWRVRAKDPAGSNEWSAWSSPRMFEVKDGSGNFLAFFYP